MSKKPETTPEKTGASSPEFDLSNPFSSALAVLRAVVFSPKRFFLNFETEGPLREPAIFALLIGALSGALSLLAAPVLAFFFESEAGQTWGVSFGLSPLAAFGFMVLSPVFVALAAAIYLVSVRTFVGKVGDFRQMFRMAAYAYSAMVLAWVPLVGAFAITYSLMVTMGIGVRFIHRTSFMTALITALTGFVPMALILSAFRGFAF